MAGPYETLAYFAEKERQESTRRQFAREFAEYQRLNPEATKDEMVGFLSMAGQTPFGIAPPEFRLDAIASRNAETKARRLMEEAREKQIRTAKENEAVSGVFMKNLGLYGGDERKALEATRNDFGVTAGAPGSDLIDARIKGLDTGALTANWQKNKRDQFLPDAIAMINNGATMEDINAKAPIGMANDAYIQSAWNKANEERLRQKTQQERQDVAYEQQQKDRETAQSEAKKERARNAAAMLAKGMKPLEVEAMYAEDIKDPEFNNLVRTFAQSSYTALKNAADAKLPEMVEAEGKKQIETLGLKTVASSGKDGMYEGKPYVTAAAEDFARTYALNPTQTQRVRQALADGKVAKAKTSSEVMEILRKTAFANGAEAAISLNKMTAGKLNGELNKQRVGSFEENLSHELQQYNDVAADLDARIRDAEKDPAALQRLAIEAAAYGEAAKADIVEGAAPTAFGTLKSWDRKRAYAEADRMASVFAQKQKQIAALLDQHKYKPGLPKGQAAKQATEDAMFQSQAWTPVF